jgi:SAM-dependent methyltransferase
MRCAGPRRLRSEPELYSREWYETFLESIPADVTESELAFVHRQLPRAVFPALLDLCCGPARHAAGLVQRGYRVTGVDANAQAIARAHARCAGGSFAVCDMRALAFGPGSFDGVLNLWHSFGYFDDATNRAVVRQLSAALRPRGRAILDVYNRDHFAQRPAVEATERAGRRIRSSRTWNGPRLRIVLEYDGEPGDVLEWRLYTPAELRELCSSAGLTTLLECAWFDETLPPSREHARMQLVLERDG